MSRETTDGLVVLQTTSFRGAAQGLPISKGRTGILIRDFDDVVILEKLLKKHQHQAHDLPK